MNRDAPGWSTRAASSLLLAASLAFRLIRVGSPFLDSLEERQAQVAMMTTHLVHGFTWWCTRLDIFGPPAHCSVFEFPATPLLVAGLWRLFGEQAWLARGVTIVFGMATVVVTWRFAARLFGERFALVTLALVGLSPMHVYMSRSFQVDVPMVFCVVVSVERWVNWLQFRRERDFWLSATAGMFALLQKPTGAVLFGGVWAACWAVDGWRSARRPRVWIYHAVVGLPFLAWFFWARYQNSLNTAMPVVWADWSHAAMHSFRSVATLEFWRAIAQNVGIALLTPVGVAFVLVACVKVRGDSRMTVLWGWLFVTIAGIFLLADANKGHPYYQLSLLPVGALISAAGARWVWEQPSVAALRATSYWPVVVRGALIGGCLVYAVFWIPYYRYMYDTHTRMPWVGSVAEVIRDSSAPEEAFVLFQPLASPTVVTYYARRASWSFSPTGSFSAGDSIDRWIAQGARLFVAVDTRYASAMDSLARLPALTTELSRFRTVTKTRNYTVIDLRCGGRPPRPFDHPATNCAGPGR